MTIDKEKLKALAEAATPGRHYDRLESAGGGIKYECTGDDGSLVLKVDHKNNEFGFVGDRGEADEAFFLACSPATILGLLAEIERLKTFVLRRRDQADQYDEAFNKVCDQRDQLKAENEALRRLVLSALEEGKGSQGSGGNAPGHCHEVPGVWDRGNGDRSGTPCGWCRIWNAAQAMAKEASHG